MMVLEDCSIFFFNERVCLAVENFLSSWNLVPTVSDFFKVNGIVRDFILSELKLHDGGTYYVTLISCNGAQICSSATSPGILVDSTPPNRGKRV